MIVATTSSEFGLFSLKCTATWAPASGRAEPGRIAGLTSRRRESVISFSFLTRLLRVHLIQKPRRPSESKGRKSWRRAQIDRTERIVRAEQFLPSSRRSLLQLLTVSPLSPKDEWPKLAGKIPGAYVSLHSSSRNLRKENRIRLALGFDLAGRAERTWH